MPGGAPVHAVIAGRTAIALSSTCRHRPASPFRSCHIRGSGAPGYSYWQQDRLLWVNNLWWRLAHLATIVVVVLQAWLGRYCSLTKIETSLRVQAGQGGYERSFIEHWAAYFLYIDGPIWGFAVVYTGFALLVELDMVAFSAESGQKQEVQIPTPTRCFTVEEVCAHIGAS